MDVGYKYKAILYYYFSYPTTACMHSLSENTEEDIDSAVEISLLVELVRNALRRRQVVDDDVDDAPK